MSNDYDVQKQTLTDGMARESIGWDVIKRLAESNWSECVKRGNIRTLPE